MAIGFGYLLGIFGLLSFYSVSDLDFLSFMLEDLIIWYCCDICHDNCRMWFVNGFFGFFFYRLE